MATWPHHVISLVIPSNNIPLSLPIALTHHLIPDGSYFWYTKPYSSIIGNRLFYTELLKSAPAVIPIVGKHTIRHQTLVRLISPLSPLPPYNFEQLVLRWLWANLGPFSDHTLNLELERLGDQLHDLLHAASMALWDIDVCRAICVWISSDNWSGHYKRSPKPQGRWRGIL